jgi:uncharacterized membrane protein YidH (DUF202 family)
MLRTIYRRTAFQLESNNAVRISIDTDLRFVDETALGRGMSQWQAAVRTVESQYVRTFPYGIVEIKLATNDPIPWLAELLQCGLLTVVPKFSKFLHGTALLHGDRVRSLPPWWDELNRVPTVAYRSVAAAPIRRAVVSAAAAAAAADDDADDDNSKGSESDAGAGRGNDGDMRNAVPLTVMVSKAEVSASPKLPAFRAHPLRLPIKIEPKTFFANERTFLQWLNTLLLLAVGSSAFIAYGSQPFQIAGTLLVVISLVFVLYALAIYHWRRRAIVRRSVTRAYDDQYGPAALVALVILTFLLSVVLQFVVEPQSLVQAEPLPSSK